MLHCMLPHRPMAPRAAMWRSGRATPSIATRALAASCDGHRGTARGGQTMRKIGWLILGLAGVLSAPVRADCEDSVVLVHAHRSEERREGKAGVIECRCRRRQWYEKQTTE